VKSLLDRDGLLDAGLPSGTIPHRCGGYLYAFDCDCQNAPSTAEIRFRGKLLDYRERHFTPMEMATYWRLGTPTSTVPTWQFVCTRITGRRKRLRFVFCRNVLIYFDRATQERAILVLDKLLSATGFLFVGPAEAGLFVRQTMISAGIPLAFAFRKIQAATPGTLPFGRAPQAVPTSRPTTGNSCARNSPARPPPPEWRSRHRQATGRAHAQPRHAACQPGAIGRGGRHLPTTSTAKPGLPQPRFCLMGLVSDAGGNHIKAREHYRKALYLEPNHREALTHLAALLEMQGDAIGARLMNERAKRSQVRNYD